MGFQYFLFLFFKPIPPLPQYYWTWWKPEDADITSKSTDIYWKGKNYERA